MTYSVKLLVLRSLITRFSILLVLFFPALASAVTPMVAAGDGHTVALKSDGTLAAWGYNFSGQLGDGTTTQRLSPVAVPGLTGVVAVATGTAHTVAIKSDATVVAWGDNYSGQLGDGTWTQRNSPVAVPGLTGVVAVVAGYKHTVALKSDGTVVAWGGNGYGQLGDGTTTDRKSPVAVPGLTGVVSVSVGSKHTVALKSDGTVAAWGYNFSGQLGNGTTTERSSPAAVPGLTGVVAVSAGFDHTVALKSDGTVVAWGANGSGQLGDGTTTQRNSPVAVPGLTGVVAVATGTAHTVAIKSDGSVVAWGANAGGQLGDGTATQRKSPVAVPGLTGVVAVSAGSNHTVALKSDGTVAAWGYNSTGQLGDGTTALRYSPVAVAGLNIGSTNTPSTSTTSTTTTSTTVAPTTTSTTQLSTTTTASTTTTTLGGTGGGVTLEFRVGWNLVGNSTTSAIDVVSNLGDKSKVTTVWKWDSANSAWAFYSPLFATAAELSSYAAGKGYQVLSSIGPGQGFWVNATQPFALTLSGTTPYGLGASDLVTGWNLVATGDTLSPAQMDAKLGGTSGAPSFSTMWAWNASGSAWYFYAPSLAVNGTLASYIQSKSYLDFGSLATGGGLGFWINKNAPAAGSSSATISGFSPASGAVGTTVTISGTNFDPTAANNTVKFNGTAATVTSATATSLDVSVPSGAASGAITVTTAAGTATSATGFTVSTAETYPLVGTWGFLIGSVGSGSILFSYTFSADGTFIGKAVADIPGYGSGSCTMTGITYTATDSAVTFTGSPVVSLSGVATAENCPVTPGSGTLAFPYSISGNVLTLDLTSYSGEIFSMTRQE